MICVFDHLKVIFVVKKKREQPNSGNCGDDKGVGTKKAKTGVDNPVSPVWRHHALRADRLSRYISLETCSTVLAFSLFLDAESISVWELPIRPNNTNPSRSDQGHTAVETRLAEFIDPVRRAAACPSSQKDARPVTLAYCNSPRKEKIVGARR